MFVVARRIRWPFGSARALHLLLNLHRLTDQLQTAVEFLLPGFIRWGLLGAALVEIDGKQLGSLKEEIMLCTPIPRMGPSGQFFETLQGFVHPDFSAPNCMSNFCST